MLRHSHAVSSLATFSSLLKSTSSFKGGLRSLIQGRLLTFSDSDDVTQWSGQTRGYSRVATAQAEPVGTPLVLDLGSMGSNKQTSLTPSAVVTDLDKHVIGQDAAKRAVAVALRNRWRRRQVSDVGLRDEIMPKNILMVGPTGSGKTEIARRLAKLADAPFVKVEATKYTELGYVGRDVEEIIENLVEAAILLVKQKLREHAKEIAVTKAENVVLRAMLGESVSGAIGDSFRVLYRAGRLDDRTVEIDASALSGDGADSGASNANSPFGKGSSIPFDRFLSNYQSQSRPDRAYGGGAAAGFGGPGGKKGGVSGSGSSDKKSMKVREARQKLEDAEIERLLSGDRVTKEALRVASQDGVVFIDEIDKIVDGNRGGGMGGGGGGSRVSAEGVQRDLLPVIEGSAVHTKHGVVRTDHILFICAGAFHSAKPSDMLAELQGRLPIRVDLKGLSAADFKRILTEPENNLIRQNQELLLTEGVRPVFTDKAVEAISWMAEEANRTLENIGARRLYTILERLLVDLSFNAVEKAKEARDRGDSEYVHVIDEPEVQEVVGKILKKPDLSKYIL